MVSPVPRRGAWFLLWLSLTASSVNGTKETNIISPLHVPAMAPGPSHPLSHGLITILHGRFLYPLSAHERILTLRSPAPAPPAGSPGLPHLPLPHAPSLLIHSYKSSHVAQLRAIIPGLKRNQSSSKEAVHQATFFLLLEYLGLWAVASGVGTGLQVNQGTGTPIFSRSPLSCNSACTEKGGGEERKGEPQG